MKTLSEYQELLKQPGKHIIKMSASWCGPCRTLKATIDSLEDSIKNLFIEIDADEADDDLTQQLKVRSVPTLIFYDGDKEYARLIGAVSKNKILDTL